MHPVRAASALVTLAEAFPGRLAAVVGRGESSLANEGIRPPALTAYAAMLAELRERLAERSTSVRVLGAASGPRTTEVTARELGAVLVDVGTDPAGVAAAVTRARAADPGVVVWAFVRMAIAHDPAEALAASAPLLGSCAARMAAAPEWYGVSATMHQPVTDLARAHDYRRHGTEHALQDAGSMDAPGLAAAAELVRERFVLAASPAEVEQRFRALAATGIAGLVLAGGLPGVVTRLPELGEAARDLVQNPRTQEKQ
jgi:alkanesulfonate monooxygenase SsuD/methylene tetrahydromethanopterin reductase-like flavin-dependent oxidoreductase (luciferase family)